MSHCIANQRYRIAHIPIAQGRVEYNDGIYTIFLSKKLKEIAPNSYEFLSHWGKKSIAIAQEGFSKETKDRVQENAIKQVAINLTTFAVSLSYCSMNYFPAILASLPMWFLVSKLTNCADERIKTRAVDAGLVEESTIQPETLKGGILFYKACQKVNQEKSRIFFTSSGENRFSVLESTPTFKERITQLEKKLNNLGEPWECTETDQETIKKIEKLFCSNM
ncbi:MAG: hypothetical protein C5B45_05935 [Chlamydiae bacterium]|nr:MAG: hypothetical protein C5B45_05935 [Chlamydiota bacterium]